MIPVFANSNAGVWMPEQASNVAPQVDQLFYFILWLCIILFIGISFAVFFFILKYRGKPGQPSQKSPAHSTALEMTWTVIPTIVVMVIFYMGFRGYLDMTTPPPNAYEIRVTAKMWSWQFVYPNGAESTDLYIPKDRPVRLIMQSEDVIHSLYVPVFRLKKDVVPGRLTHMWFQATMEGEFDLYCAEYCGQEHSMMRRKVHVQEASVFAKWVEDTANKIDKLPELTAEATPDLVQQYVDIGKGLYVANCKSCHSIDGARLIGPSFKGLYGTTHPLVGGTDVTVTDEYIRESIRTPGAKVVQGYDNVMPPYKGKDKSVTALIQYIKSLK